MRHHEGIRHHDETAIRLVCLCGNDGFEFGRASNRCDDRLHGKSGGGGLERVQINVRIACCCCGVEQDCDPVDARGDLLEQLEPLPGHRLLHGDEAGDVAAGARNARHELLDVL